MSTVPAMVDTAARRRYAGETRPIATKQMAQKDSGAHPDHAGVDDRAGGPTERWVDVHSNHGGPSHDDGDVSATAVDKTVNQLGTKHHGIAKKLKQGFTRSEAHRRALATTALARRRFCRP